MVDPASLDDLRAEIDRLDGVLHDALVARAAVVERVAEAKRTTSGEVGSALRPDREAAMAAALDARDAGAFPKLSLHRIQREVIGALTQSQMPFTVHLGAADPELLDGARFAFGAAADMVLHASSLAALEAAGARPADLAVLRLDGSGWWARLPERAGVVMRIADGFVIGPRLTLDWDVGLAIGDAGESALESVGADGLHASTDSAALDSPAPSRHIGGYMNGPWVSFRAAARA